MTEAQNGFREKRSTERATQSFLEIVQESVVRDVNAVGVHWT
jgi:hypothetical protein